jgi:tyrosyl-tRNA synthetase
MSKSLGNYIGVDEPAAEIFGKVMSISDDLMWRYFELLSFKDATEVEKLRQSIAEGANPRDVKFALAHELAARFSSEREAHAAQAEFVARFAKGALPEDLPLVEVVSPAEGVQIARLLKELGLVSGTSEAMRLIQQGGVKIDGNKVEDRGLVLNAGVEAVFQVGKRKFAKARLVEKSA